MFTPVDLELDVIEAYGINTTTSCTDGWVYKAPEGSSTLITEVMQQPVGHQKFNIVKWFTEIILTMHIIYKKLC